MSEFAKNYCVNISNSLYHFETVTLESFKSFRVGELLVEVLVEKLLEKSQF
jgi:hypothetical protein